MPLRVLIRLVSQQAIILLIKLMNLTALYLSNLRTITFLSRTYPILTIKKHNPPRYQKAIIIPVTPEFKEDLCVILCLQLRLS